MTRFASLALGFILAAGCGGQGTPSAPTAPGTVTSRDFFFAATGATYPYLIYAPAAWRPDKPLPALLLVHGGGGRGTDMLRIWRSFADTHGIVLIAPTFPLDAAFETYVPRLFPALMDSVHRLTNVDPKRLFVFGYSAGGYSTYDAAILTNTFAGAGVFAAIITPDYYGIIAQAKRKTPIAIYIGDHDQFFTLAQTRATRDTLLGAGFPVHYVEIAHQDHNYAAASGFVDADVWAFMNR